MQIGDNLHEMSDLVSGKNKKIIQNVICRKLMFSILWAIKQQTTYRNGTFLIFPENTVWHFMQIVPIGDNMHEISNPVSWEKLDISKCRLLKIDI